MKPQEYFDNRNQQIKNQAAMTAFEVGNAVKYGETAMDKLRLRTIEFISLTPDENGFEVSEVWVNSWKKLYDRISNAIREVKDVGDYKLDAKRREFSSLATALLAARRAVYWED